MLRRFRSFAVKVLFALPACWYGVSFAALPETEELIKALQIPAKQVGELNTGEVISYPISETSDKELAIGVAMVIKTPVKTVVGYIRKGDFAAIDPDVVASGEIAGSAGPAAFKRFAFGPGDTDEVEMVLDARPGDRFNFSAEELERFGKLGAKLEWADVRDQAREVSAAYRDVLFDRWRAYRERGLKGIAPYVRDRGRADPAAELRLATTGSRVFSRYFPELYRAWLDYPARLPEGAEEQFFWANRKVENRPTAILSHRITAVFEEGALIASRQFYVGHSYNSSQLIAGCLPYAEGTAVFYVHRTSTDQVAGMAKALRHKIGRDRLKEVMIQRMNRFKRQVALH